MELILDKRAEAIVDSLSEVDQGRVLGYLDLFREKKFGLPQRYLKKIDRNLWELRPGNIRLLLGKVGSIIVVVNVFKKKSQKTPKNEIKTARNRLKEYEL